MKIVSTKIGTGHKLKIVPKTNAHIINKLSVGRIQNIQVDFFTISQI